MAQRRKFTIETPRGKITTVNRKDGTTTSRLEWAPGFKPDKEAGFASAQDFIDSEVLRKMNPLTPRDTGVMIKSATLGTVIGSGVVEYLTPYARRQYYEHKTKRKWFETMKKGNLESIRKGAAKFIAK